MNSFFRFMVTRAGGILRIIVGLSLIVVGICWGQGMIGYSMVIAGLVPLLAGVFDKCVFAPLFKLPLDGSTLRQKIK